MSIIEVLSLPLTAKKIAKVMNEIGFYVLTFGHDEIVNDTYYVMNNDNLIEDHLVQIQDVRDENYIIPDFHYKVSINSSMIKYWKRSL